MTHTDHDQASRQRTANRTPEPAELGLAVTRIFKTPLAALRASMESLSRGLEENDPRRELLSGALAEVLRLGRDVEALASFAAPRALMPLRCSLEEIVQGVATRLTPEQAARVSIARPASPSHLFVDGPALTSALTHILQVALESSHDDVLLQARQDANDTRFAVVENADHDSLALAMGEHEWKTFKQASLGLGYSLAARDVARMGGDISVERSSRGSITVSIRVPSDASAQAA